MSRKIQEDLIFPGEIFKCPVCDEKNQYFVKVTPRGLTVWDGVLCKHSDRTKIGKILTKYEALDFLGDEKKDAEDLCVQATGEKRTNILQFVSNVNTALSRMRLR